MTDKIHDLLGFVAFTHEIRNVKRALWVKDEEQFENDSEHSYQLAMIAMYVIEKDHLGLNLYKAMALALVHDVIEVYAGDTPSFGATELIDTQAAREHEARVRLRQQWPQMQLMHELIDEYEARDSKESRFVYALDKLIPILNNYLDNGRNWKRSGITLEDHVRAKAKKAAIDPTVKEYYDDIIKVLSQKPELFDKAH